MNGPRDDHTKWSKPDKEKYQIEICYPLYVESKEKWYIWTYLQNRNRPTDLENNLMVTSREGLGKGILGSLGSMST